VSGVLSASEGERQTERDIKGREEQIISSHEERLEFFTSKFKIEEVLLNVNFKI
jgi:hypothetical protein